MISINWLDSGSLRHIPILEPDLNRALSHVDFLSNPVTNRCCRGRVLVEFNFEKRQLILGGSLAFLVLLLLSQSTLAGWTTRLRRRSVAIGARGR